MTAPPLEYRRYKDGDLPAVQALHVAALKAANAYDEGDIRQALDADFTDVEGYYLTNGGTFLLGVEGHGMLICSGALRHVTATVFEVCRMRTHPNYQGLGYGQAMYTQLEQHAKKHHSAMVILRTDTRLITAQKFYERQGFKRCSPVGHHWEQAAPFNGALYFEKLLKP